MVGELVRREAEIAIAPLTINSQREQVKLKIQGDSLNKNQPPIIFPGFKRKKIHRSKEILCKTSK